MSQPKTPTPKTVPSDRSWLEAFGAFLEKGVDRLFHRTQHPETTTSPGHPPGRGQPIQNSENQTGLTA